MSFVQKMGTLIRKSDKHMYKLNINNGIVLHNIDSNLKFSSSLNLFDGNFSSSDVHFDIKEDDTLYGIINDKNGNLINISIKDNNIEDLSHLIEYDPFSSLVKFPFIKSLNECTHIFYYKQDSDNVYSLIHHYKEDNVWIEQQISLINQNILNNFILTWIDNNPNVFYFNTVNGFEQLFVASFNLDTLSWSESIQITNSNTNKVYLSIIKDLSNFHHIVYSECINNKYSYSYVNGYLSTKESITFDIIQTSIINSITACTHPNIIEHSSILYAQWVELHDLYISKSTDFGKTWSKPVMDKTAQDYAFNKYIYKSNYSVDKNYNLNSVFGCSEFINLLGF